MSAAVPWFLLNTPHQPCLPGWCRGSRFTPLVLPLKPLYPGPLKTALPERNRRRARTQLPLDLAIAQPLRQGKHDSRPEYISSRQSTRLRPALQFLALLLTHLQQLPMTSHAIETQWPCFTYHRDGPLVTFSDNVSYYFLHWALDAAGLCGMVFVLNHLEMPQKPKNITFVALAAALFLPYMG